MSGRSSPLAGASGPEPKLNRAPAAPPPLRSYSFAFSLKLNNHSFAFFQRDGEFSVAHRQGILAEHIVTPAVKSGNLLILVGGKPLNVLGVGDQARGYAGFLCPEPQQGLEQIDHRR